MTTHIVRDGECIESIAERAGHFWRTLWDHADNAALKDARRDPNLLAPGDVVAVPPLQHKTVVLDTSRVHRFRRKGVPSRLRVQFLNEGKPIAGRAYTLEIGSRVVHGETDGDGRIDHPIPARATGAVVRLEGEPPYAFLLGGLDPIDTTRGVAQRLCNLGYDCSPDEEDPVALRSAILRLQDAHGLEVSGEIDPATRAALRDDHGC